MWIFWSSNLNRTMERDHNHIRQNCTVRGPSVVTIFTFWIWLEKKVRTYSGVNFHYSCSRSWICFYWEKDNCGKCKFGLGNVTWRNISALDFKNRTRLENLPSYSLLSNCNFFYCTLVRYFLFLINNKIN